MHTAESIAAVHFALSYELLKPLYCKVYAVNCNTNVEAYDEGLVVTQLNRIILKMYMKLNISYAYNT